MEVIATIDPPHSEEFENYNELRFGLDASDRAAFFGIGRDEKSTRIAEATVLEALGCDPNEQQRVKAIWRSGDQSIPVTITGVIAEHNGEKIFRTEEYPGRGIEESKIGYGGQREQTSVSDTENELRQEIAALREEVSRLSTEVGSLRHRLEIAEGERESLRAENTRLGSRVQQLEEQIRVAGLEPIPANGSPPPAPPAPEPTPEPSPPPTPTPSEPPPADPAVIPARPRIRDRGSTRWYSPAGWRDTLSGRRAQAYLINRRVPEGEIEPDREVVIEDNSRAKIAAGVIGGLAVGAFIFWLGTRLGHDHADEIKKVITQNNYLDHQNDIIQNQLSTANSHINQLSSQLSHDTKTIDHMADQINDLKNSAKANHQLLVDLKHQEAKELASGGIRFSGDTHTETLTHNGDTIWNHVSNLIERRTGRRPNIDMVRKVTDKVLRLNGLRWDHGGFGVNAHKLPVGFHFKIPTKLL